MSIASPPRTALVSDICDSLGLGAYRLDPSLPRLFGSLPAEGTARTVRFEPADSRTSAPYDALIDFLDSLQPGECVVVSAGSSLGHAVWGELFSCAALGRGVNLVVIDGYLRDAAAVRALGMNVHARGAFPADYAQRGVPVAFDGPISIAGARCAPGDWVISDDDGVIVVEPGARDRILEAARLKDARESSVRAGLLGGATLRSVWEEYGVL